MADVTTDLPDGWVLVHEQAESTEPIAGQGILQVTPGVYRAEKQINGTLVSAQGETTEALAAAAQAVEESVQAFKADPVGAPVTEAPEVPVSIPDSSGEVDTGPLKTVIGPDGEALTDEEWSLRSKADTIVTHDGQTFFSGVGENTGQIDELSEEKLRNEQEGENVRAGEDPVETQQFSYDTADAIDSPGISAGGTLVIPDEIEASREDAAQQMTELAHSKENQRVLEAQAKADSAVVVALTDSPTLAAQIEAEKARVDAVLAERDSQPAEEQRADTGEAKQTAASIKAAEEKSNDEPNATQAARDLAEDEGVDLSKVKGTGEKGRITVGDVEQHLDK